MDTDMFYFTIGVVLFWVCLFLAFLLLHCCIPSIYASVASISSQLDTADADNNNNVV